MDGFGLYFFFQILVCNIFFDLQIALPVFFYATRDIEIVIKYIYIYIYIYIKRDRDRGK